MENKETYAIHLKAANNYEWTKIGELEVKPGYALIEVKAGGIGPYDLYHLNGQRKLRQDMIHVPGCEGSGIVRKVGSEEDKDLLNKNIAFLTDYNDPNSRGAWAEYAVVPTSLIMEIDQKNPNFEAAAYVVANPVTALGMYYDLLKGKKCIVQDTASGSLGRMVTKLCVQHNIQIINICRKEANKKILEDVGGKLNYSTDSKTVFEDLQAIINELKPTFYISYTGGNFPSRVFSLLPPGSEMCVLGNMSGEDLDGYTSQDFIFQDKFITGWSIFNFAPRYEGGMKKLLQELKESFEKGENTYDTLLGKEFKLSNIQEAVKYYQDNMSQGKIVLKP